MRVVRDGELRYVFLPPRSLAQAEERKHEALQELRDLQEELEVVQRRLRDSRLEVENLNKVLRGEWRVKDLKLEDRQEISEERP